METGPCTTRLVAVGRSPCVVNTTVSLLSDAVPVALNTAPAVELELSQPRPRPMEGFEHGQATAPATPGAQKLVNVGQPSTRATMWKSRAASSAKRSPAGSTGVTNWPYG